MHLGFVFCEHFQLCQEMFLYWDRFCISNQLQTNCMLRMNPKSYCKMSGLNLCTFRIQSVQYFSFTSPDHVNINAFGVDILWTFSTLTEYISVLRSIPYFQLTPNELCASDQPRKSSWDVWVGSVYVFNSKCVVFFVYFTKSVNVIGFWGLYFVNFFDFHTVLLRLEHWTTYMLQIHIYQKICFYG